MNFFSALTNISLLGQNNTQGAANVNLVGAFALQNNTQVAGNSATVIQGNI